MSHFGLILLSLIPLTQSQLFPVKIAMIALLLQLHSSLPILFLGVGLHVLVSKKKKMEKGQIITL
jgi:hypothetical protein